LDDEQPSAGDLIDALKRSGLADFGDTEGAPPCRPQILFILSPNEAFEIKSENQVARGHQVERGKRDGDRCGPAGGRLASGGSPHSIPSGIEIAASALFLHDQAVALRSQRVDLKDVSVAAVVRSVDDDLEIVIQILTEVAAEFACGDPFRR